MSEQVKLEKTLSPMQVCALALGSIVGWGCFVLPGDMFLPKAGPLGTLYGFMIGAFLICFVAVCLSYMIKYAPVAGGAFAYAYIGFGPTAAFVCGWALVIGYIAIVAIDIAALSVIFRFLFPGIFEFGPLYAIAGWQVYTGEVLLMTAGTLIFGWINYRGIGIAGKIQLVLAFMLTIGIVALFAGVVALDSSQLSNLTPGFSENGSPLSCVLLIFAISPFLFVGFDTVPQAAEEFSFDPARARNIMIIAIVVGVILYAMVMLAVGMAISYPEMLAKLDAQRAPAVPPGALAKWQPWPLADSAVLFLHAPYLAQSLQASTGSLSRPAVYCSACPAAGSFQNGLAKSIPSTTRLTMQCFLSS